MSNTDLVGDVLALLVVGGVALLLGDVLAALLVTEEDYSQTSPKISIVYLD